MRTASWESRGNAGSTSCSTMSRSARRNSGVQKDTMAPVTCLQSQAWSSCSKQQAVLRRGSPSCSPRSFLIPALGSSLSSFLAAPNHASSSLLLKPLSYGRYLCTRQSKFQGHTKSGSSVCRLLQRFSVRAAHLENGAWRLASENGLQKRCLRVIAKANDSTADEPQSSEMSLENALKLLGVGEGASFEEILKAKKVMMDRSGGDQEQIIQVEAAYDMLLMQSLSQRRSGKVVNSAVRYADVRKPKSSSSGVGPEWMQKALKSAPVSFQTPSTSELGTQTAIFAALIIWTFATGVMSSSSQGAAAGQDTPGFILAVGFGLAIFFLRKQNIKLGKASLITIGGLVSGALLGGLVESWLRVDLFPVFGIASPAIVVKRTTRRQKDSVNNSGNSYHTRLGCKPYSCAGKHVTSLSICGKSTIDVVTLVTNRVHAWGQLSAWFGGTSAQTGDGISESVGWLAG